MDCVADSNLNEVYLKSDIFKDQDIPVGLDLPLLKSNDLEGVQYPILFIQVTRYLGTLAEAEILHGHKPAFLQWADRAGEFKAQLVNEMQHYARQQYPYNQPYDESEGIYLWWKSLEGLPSAKILPVRSRVTAWIALTIANSISL